jgi:hypothetical protein
MWMLHDVGGWWLVVGRSWVAALLGCWVAELLIELDSHS